MSAENAHIYAEFELPKTAKGDPVTLQARVDVEAHWAGIRLRNTRTRRVKSDVLTVRKDNVYFRFNAHTEIHVVFMGFLGLRFYAMKLSKKELQDLRKEAAKRAEAFFNGQIVNVSTYCSALNVEEVKAILTQGKNLVSSKTRKVGP